MKTIKSNKAYLNKLLLESTSKRDVKLYEKFIGVLTALEQKECSEDQRDLIEKKLEILDLDQETKHRKKIIKKGYSEFVGYLQTEFSWILKDYYANYGLSIGMVFGLALGTSIFRDSGSSATGMCFGMLIGYFIGQNMDKKAAKENKVLSVA